MIEFMGDFGINILMQKNMRGLCVPVFTEGPEGIRKGPCTP